MTGYIPTLEQIDELHRKIAPSKAAYELVHTHCVIVATSAARSCAGRTRCSRAAAHYRRTRRYRPPQASPAAMCRRVCSTSIWYSSADCCMTSAPTACSSMTALTANRSNSARNATFCTVLRLRVSARRGRGRVHRPVLPQPYRRGTYARGCGAPGAAVATSRLCADESRAGSGDVRRQVP